MSECRDTILQHFQSGGTLTKIQAIYAPFKTTNLGDKILHLRRAGYPIEKRWKETPTGKRFAEYFMAQKEQ